MCVVSAAAAAAMPASAFFNYTIAAYLHFKKRCRLNTDVSIFICFSCLITGFLYIYVKHKLYFFPILQHGTEM